MFATISCLSSTFIWWYATRHYATIKQQTGGVYMTFGDKLQALRKSKGMSQEQLASQLSVSRQAISKWELNSSIPDTENIIRISEIFNVTTDYLLKDYIENSSHTINQVYEQPTRQKKRGLAAIIMMVVGGIGVLTFWILSSIYPVVMSYVSSSSDGNVSDTIVRYGLPAFLEYHNMNLLFGLCLIVAVLGLIIYLIPLVKDKFKFNK